METKCPLFIIQTIKGDVVHDFSFGLIDAIKYNNWYYNEKKYDYQLWEQVPSTLNFSGSSLMIPVGTVEFVQNFVSKHYGIENIAPINIPQELMEPAFTKRKINIEKFDVPMMLKAEQNSIYVKDNKKIKSFHELIDVGSQKQIPEGEYLISDEIHVESEWRAFIYNKKLVGLQNYAGDFTRFPNVLIIKEMIEKYKSCPKAYTLDVAADGRNTFIIEVHNFFSCGLYGFSDSTILPKMFIDGFKEIISIA